MPLLRRAARPGGPRLPAGERVQALSRAVDEPDSERLAEVLSRGRLEVVGRLVDASNATLYASACLDEVEVACVYKPVAGERPLWDFPSRTLARREVAACVVSDATGWDVVPPTVLRADGPLGGGSVQAWVGPGPDEELPDPGAGLVDVVPAGALPAGWRRVLEASGPDGGPVVLAHADDPRLRRMAVLDAVLNNADRKGGHVLVDAAGRVRGVDHGVTFHVEDKLRTVLWGWAGQRLGEEAVEVLRRLDRELDGGALEAVLGDLLSRAEVRATAARVDRLLARGRLPRPGGGWPSIPWPPF